MYSFHAFQMTINFLFRSKTELSSVNLPRLFVALYYIKYTVIFLSRIAGRLTLFQSTSYFLSQQTQPDTLAFLQFTGTRPAIRQLHNEFPLIPLQSNLYYRKQFYSLTHRSFLILFHCLIS